MERQKEETKHLKLSLKHRLNHLMGHANNDTVMRNNISKQTVSTTTLIKVTGQSRAARPLEAPKRNENTRPPLSDYLHNHPPAVTSGQLIVDIAYGRSRIV